MPGKKYSVDLTDAERTTLTTLIKTGRSAARTITRAQTLLAAADGHRDTDSAALLRIGTATVNASGGASWKKAWPLRSPNSPDPAVSANSTRNKKPCSLHSRGVPPRTTDPVEPCSSWPTRWSRGAWSRRFPMKRCAAFSKKRPQTMDGAPLVCADRRGRVRLAHGRFA